MRFHPSKSIQAITIFLLGALMALGGVFVFDILHTDLKPSADQLLCEQVIRTNKDLLTAPAKLAVDEANLNVAADNDPNSKYFDLILEATQQVDASKAKTEIGKVEQAPAWKEVVNLCEQNFPNAPAATSAPAA